MANGDKKKDTSTASGTPNIGTASGTPNIGTASGTPNTQRPREDDPLSNENLEKMKNAGTTWHHFK